MIAMDLTVNAFLSEGSRLLVAPHVCQISVSSSLMSPSTSSGHNAENAYRRFVPQADICTAANRWLFDRIVSD
jgi:hypothetical protein